MKILTIVVPSYNVEKYLERTLFSFVNENIMNDIEVIVVNDGSKDRTVEIAQSFCDRYPGTFSLINKENGGHGSTINAGLKKATGKFFKVVDGDDWLDTDSLVKLIGKLKMCSADVVSMHYRLINMISSDGWDVREDNIEYDTELSVDEVDFTRRYFSIHSVIYRTSLLKDNNIVISEGIFYVDVEYTLMPLIYAKTFCFYDLNLYRYVIGNPNQSVSNANYVKRYEHHNTVMKNCINFINKHEDIHPEIYNYLCRIINLCCQTQYRICFEFDDNAQRGTARQREFDAFLKTNAPYVYERINKENTRVRLLRRVNFDENKYNRLAKVRISKVLSAVLPGRVYGVLNRIFK